MGILLDENNEETLYVNSLNIQEPIIDNEEQSVFQHDVTLIDGKSNEPEVVSNSPRCKLIPIERNEVLTHHKYLGEFETNWEKRKARENLGIFNTESDISWGKIKGNINQQTDLIDKFENIDVNNLIGGFRQVDTIFERNIIPLSKKHIGMLCYVTETDIIYKWTGENWEPLKLNGSGIIKVNQESELDYITPEAGDIAYVISIDTYKFYDGNKWNTLISQGTSLNGIPIYDLLMIELLGSKLPEKYILIRDVSDLNGQVTNKTYTTTTNGNYTDILFSALRELQSEVAKLKNTFYYGVCSANEGETTSSHVIEDSEEEEREPLWAIDPNDLSEVMDISIDQGCELISSFGELNPFIVNENNIEIVKLVELPLDKRLAILDVEELKIVIYGIITPNNNWKYQISFSGKLLDIENFIPKQDCNILIVISRKLQSEEEFYGKNYIWINVTNRAGEVIKQGYLSENLSNIIINEPDYADRLIFNNIYLNNLELYKLSTGAKSTSFTNEDILPIQPTEDNFTFKAAHITIRSISTKAVLDQVKNRLLTNELIYLESTKTLWIKSRNGLIELSGGSSSDMTIEDVQEWLVEQNLAKQDESGDWKLVLENIGNIRFIHELSGNMFDVGVDSEGNLVSRKVEDSRSDEGYSGTDQYKNRGAVARYVLGETKWETTNNADISTVIGDNAYIFGDRVRIGSWYIPKLGQKNFNCSHDFIEIVNSGTVDYPLNNIKLGLAIYKDGVRQLLEFELNGQVKAGSSYTIRAKQRLSLDSEQAYVKVENYDYELWQNGEQVDTQYVEAILLYHKNGNVSIQDGFTPLWTSDVTSFKAKVVPWLVDVVLLNGAEKTYEDAGHNKVWGQASYTVPENSIAKDQYNLDPAKQGFRSLTGLAAESSNWRLEKVACEPIPLNRKEISFPHSDLTNPVNKFTPKASYENKNICTDKTAPLYNKPNMVTCSYGIDGNTTRCFNWFSLGFYDEFVFIREKNTTTWHKFESYKETDADGTTPNTYPCRKEFASLINNTIYARMDNIFPGSNYNYRVHKCIVQVVSEAVSTPKEYEYVVGRELNGQPDSEYISDVQTFTLYPTSYTPVVFQVSDQQGFGWMEYLVWAAAAKEILNKINEVCTGTKYPVIINTGDMTQNGTRVNEWLDYYNAGYCLFNHLEQMNVVGNNDLCNAYSEKVLGTGDDNGKSSPYYFHTFYCYEVDNVVKDNSDWQHDLIYKGKYIPSMYYFNLGNNKYIMVNSELTSTTCDVYYNAKSGDQIINLYTGYIQNSPKQSTILENYLGDTLSNWLDNLSTNCIVACHEMPFTVISEDYLKQGKEQFDRCITESGGTPKSLIGSHLNRLNYQSSWNNDNNYWFSRLLQSKEIKLCIGGHKHTYACTYPLNDVGTSTITGYDVSKCTEISRTNGVVGGFVKGADEYFNWKAINPSGYKGVTYFMLQATGYKLKSNKELPSEKQMFSKIVPKTNWSNISSPKADDSQSYPMYAVIQPNNNNYNIDLYRVVNIKVESLEEYKTSIKEFSETQFATKPMYSEKLLITLRSSNNVFYDNYWLVPQSNLQDCTAYKNGKIQDIQRCTYNNSTFNIWKSDGTEGTFTPENSSNTISI